MASNGAAAGGADERARLVDNATSATGGSVPRSKPRLYLLFAALAVIVAVFVVAALIVSLVSGGAGGGGSHQAPFGRRVRAEAVVAHLAALQSAADASQAAGDANANRATGSVGYNRSVAYVVEQLGTGAAADYFDVERRAFNAGVWRLESAALAELTPTPRTFVLGTDFGVAHSSGAGAAPAPAGAMAQRIANGGCAAADWANAAPGALAVLRVGDGACTSADAVRNAPSHVAGVAFQNRATAMGFVAPRVASPGKIAALPVLALSHAFGEYVLNTPNCNVSFAIDATLDQVETWNVFATSRGGANASVVMVGAHLDGVPAGPGINDDGSGSAAILEIALTMARESYRPTNRVVFAWWGAEELGLLGSRHYFSTLPAAERAKVAAVLNNDMLGSPNWARYVDSVFENSTAVPPRAMRGSRVVQRLYEEYFDVHALAWVHKTIDAPGGSDYGFALCADIAAGGVETGAGSIKTAEEQELFGGFVGAAHDVCYHRACDTMANINAEVLGQNAKAVASVLQTLASHDSVLTFVYGDGGDGGGNATAPLHTCDALGAPEWEWRY